MIWNLSRLPAAAAVAAPVMPTLVVPAVREPIVIETERAGDAEARESLLDCAFGLARFRKTCQMLRVGRLPARGLSLVARDARLGGLQVGRGGIVGTVRLWHVDAGGVPALMLGPLAVEADYRSEGIGARLMDEAISRAKALGHRAILLVGDAPYYTRFGFSTLPMGVLSMPGPVEAARFLGLDLTPGALAAATGLVRPTGAADSRRGVRIISCGAPLEARFVSAVQARMRSDASPRLLRSS